MFRWAVGIGISILVAAAAVSFFAVDVCDQQLSNNGNAVEVCRHLQASDPPVIAVGLIVLAALGVFFTEISGFGVTLKREVKEASKKAEAAQKVAETTQDKINETAGDLADLGRWVVPPEEAPSTAEADLADRAESTTDRALVDCAEDYNRLRLTMPSGAPRTAAMEAVVKRMISLFEDERDLDVGASLTSSNRGLRLAAYAYLYSNPEPAWTAELVSSLVDREDKPFGQYWALRALAKQCETDPAAVDSRLRRTLTEDLQPKLPRGSDRAGVLRRVLDLCASR
jgi:hypothetical protein